MFDFECVVAIIERNMETIKQNTGMVKANKEKIEAKVEKMEANQEKMKAQIYVSREEVKTYKGVIEAEEI
jgi:hypothetical protein